MLSADAVGSHGGWDRRRIGSPAAINALRPIVDGPRLREGNTRNRHLHVPRQVARRSPAAPARPASIPVGAQGVGDGAALSADP